MLKMRKIGFLLLLALFSLVTIQPSLSSPSTPPIVYVAGDGSGDFNCDGIDDQVQINQALEYVATHSEYTTVHLKGPNTYIISDTIFVDDNTILEGDSDAVVKLVDNANWEKYKSMIACKGNPGQSPNNLKTYGITIRGFEIDGNEVNNRAYGEYHGANWYMVIALVNAYDSEIYDMYIHNNLDDGILFDNYGTSKYLSGNNKVHDNTVYESGHDAICFRDISDVEAYNNKIIARTNSGIRADNTNRLKVYNNTITSYGSGHAGIQVQKVNSVFVDDVEIYNNEIYNTALRGIILAAAGSTSTPANSKGVYIHHNLIYDTGRTSDIRCGGISIQGFDNTIIENNVLDGNYRANIIAENTYLTVGGTGYETIVRNNIITRAKTQSADSTRTGYGLANYLVSTHSFISDNNIVYNNVKGDYKNIVSTNDIHADPMFVDLGNHDYHLKANSPFIDAGIGVYSNTESGGLPPESINAAPVLNPAGTKTVYEGSTLTFTVSATDADGDSLTYSATDLPSGATFDPVSITFTWTPAKSQAGTYTVTFEVTDGDLTDSQKVDIVVNSLPEVYDNRLRESTPDATLSEHYYVDVGGIGELGYRDVIWFDLSDYNTTDTIDSATLSLFWYYEGAARSNDAVVEIYRPLDWDPGYVSWNSPWNNPGGDWSDKNGMLQGSVPYGSLTFRSADSPDNRYYEFDVTELVQDYVSGKYENTGFFLKARAENNNYIAFYSSEWGNANQRPKLSIDHRTASTGGTTGDNGEVQINRPPVMSYIGPRSVDEMSELTIMVNATDSDGDSLTYSAAGIPSGASFDTASGVFEWTPTYGQAGTYTVTFEVTDGYLSDSEDVTIYVNETAHMPTITSFQPSDNSVFDEGDIIDIKVDAYDEDGDSLSYIIKVDGVVRSISPSYAWDTQDSSAGIHTIEVVVSDGSNQAIARCTISINDATPVFDPMAYDENADGSISKAELFTARDDYSSKKITKDDMFEVIKTYFNRG